MGTILFYGQIKNDPSVFSGGYVYNKTLSLSDFFRVSYLNILWVFASFLCYNILPFSPVHPVLLIRAAMSSFSLLYILTFVGIKEASACILPQCFSILPLLMFFSVHNSIRYGKKKEGGFSLKRGEIFFIFLLSMLSGGIEVALFRLLVVLLG